MTDASAPAVDAFLDDHIDDLADLAGRLVGFDTQNPPGDTRDVGSFVQSYLEDLGVETRVEASDDAKPNVLGTLPGEDDRTLLYNGHLDTVPFDEDVWTYDPLGERDGDRLYGRGTTDMKGPLAAMLQAARALVATGTTPPVSLSFAFVSDEETGGEEGLQRLLAAGDIAADAAVIGETTCERGIHSVTVADRGSIWLTLDASGEAAHGSRPPLGVNAIDRLVDCVDEVRELLATYPLSFPAEVEAIVNESVAFYAHQLDRAAARSLFEHPSVNLGVLRGGQSINAVPEEAVARLDVRVAPGVETAPILADIERVVDRHEGVVLADVSRSVGTYEAVDSPMVDATASAAEAVTGERVYRRCATGGGDAKKLRNAGVPTVEFAVGTDTAHAVDEYTTVPALAANAHTYARLPYEFARRVDGRG